MQTSSTDRLNEVIKTLRHIHREIFNSAPERDDVAELVLDIIKEVGSIIEED